MSEDLEQIIKAQAGDQDALNYLISKWHPHVVSAFAKAAEVLGKEKP